MATSLVLLKTLIPLVILAMANSVQSETAPEHTDFYYGFEYENFTNLIYQGDVHYVKGTGLRLTKTDDAGSPLKYSAGRVLHPNPVALWNSNKRANFETTIEFIVKPEANNDDPADGLVFFIAPVNSTFPNAAAGGNFGIFNSSGNSSHVFAVEFDIYVNGEWDPKFRHLGIDFESRVSNITSEKVPDSYQGKRLRLWIHYVEATNMITVTLNAGTELLANVSQVEDLRRFLDQDVQVGLAASTGLHVATHDILLWSFDSNLENSRPGIRQYA